MISIEIIVQAELDKIKAQLPGRTARVSSALRNSVFNVMAGGGVSAPGQPPGVRTGNYRNSYSNFITIFYILIILLFHQQKATECHLQRK